MFRIGSGYDVHRLVEGRALVLGGVHIDYEKGLLGHSDADVLLHALMDALLGALALGDIGKHFPDTDDSYHNIDSRILLRKTVQLAHQAGYTLVNADTTICAEKPKLAPYIDQMRENIAQDLQTQIENISVKATTEEGLGVSGRGEGISASAIVLLSKRNAE